MDRELNSRYYIFKFDSHGFLEKSLDFNQYGYHARNEAEDAIIKSDLFGEHFIIQSYFLTSIF